MPLTHKLVTELERDIRNQVLIDQMKKLTRKGKLMVFVRRTNWVLIAGLIFCLFFWIAQFLAQVLLGHIRLCLPPIHRGH